MCMAARAAQAVWAVVCAAGPVAGLPLGAPWQGVRDALRACSRSVAFTGCGSVRRVRGALPAATNNRLPPTRLGKAPSQTTGLIGRKCKHRKVLS